MQATAITCVKALLLSLVVAVIGIVSYTYPRSQRKIHGYPWSSFLTLYNFVEVPSPFKRIHSALQYVKLRCLQRGFVSIGSPRTTG